MGTGVPLWTWLQCGGMVVSRLTRLVLSSRHLHGLISVAILRSRGCRPEYPVFLNTREFTVGEHVRIGVGCELGGEIHLEDHVSLGNDCSIHGTVDIGRGTRLNPRCEIRGNIDVGRYCAVARDVAFQEREHDHTHAAVQHPIYERLLGRIGPEGTKGPIEVGSDVWIGKDALILSGVTLGHGAVVAAKSVVTSDVEPYSIVAGVPATRKKYRFGSELRERLLDIRWWEWPEERIRERAELFDGPLQSVDDLPTTFR